MIRVEIVNVFLTEKGDEFIMLLRGNEDERTLPISIGQLEAQAIAAQLYHAEFPRPLTHDLFKNVLEKTGQIITSVVISALVDSTFFARLHTRLGQETFEFDSRPSDAIALALRFSAPIFVEESVMDESGIILPENGVGASPMENHTDKNDKPPSQELSDRLNRAIREERYEEAARIRDQLKNLSKSN